MTTEHKEEYNDDELEAPKWLDGVFFTKVLKNCEPSAKNIKLKNVKYSPAAAKEEHYGSVMFRAAIEYTIDNIDKRKSVIIKTIPEAEGIKKDLLEGVNIFEIEIGMYSEVLPRFESYLRAVGDQTKLMATLLYHELSPRKVLVFEDLVPLGYTVKRGKLPNREESELALTKLAKWHAVSYKIIKEEPQYFDKYRTSFLSHDNPNGLEFFINNTQPFMDLLRKTPELQKYLPHFEKLIGKLDPMEEAIKIYEEYRKGPRNDAFYVLSHNDFHAKNMMFKYHPITKKIDDVMLLDFQYIHVSSIATDLIYCVYMLLDKELRASKTEILQHYFKVFEETLAKIGVDGPMLSFDKLQEEIMHCKNLEIYLMMALFPYWLKNIRDGMNWEALVHDAEYRQKVIEDREYIDELLVLLPKYLEMGYIDAN